MTGKTTDPFLCGKDTDSEKCGKTPRGIGGGGGQDPRSSSVCILYLYFNSVLFIDAGLPPLER